MLNYFFFISLFILNFLLFFMYIKIAKKLGFIDKSEKFNNPVTITSAGIIFYLNLCAVFFYFFYLNHSEAIIFPNNIIFTFLAFTILFIVSTIDDLKPIDPKIRLFIQLICIYASITSIEIYYLQLPLKISILLCLIIWIYILNTLILVGPWFLAIMQFFFINTIVLTQLFDFSLFQKI